MLTNTSGCRRCARLRADAASPDERLERASPRSLFTFASRSLVAARSSASSASSRASSAVRASTIFSSASAATRRIVGSLSSLSASGERDHRARILALRERERRGEPNLVDASPSSSLTYLIDRVRATPRERTATSKRRSPPARATSAVRLTRDAKSVSSAYISHLGSRLCATMSIIDSVRVARRDGARHRTDPRRHRRAASLDRESVDERARWFGRPRRRAARRRAHAYTVRSACRRCAPTSTCRTTRATSTSRSSTRRCRRRRSGCSARRSCSRSRCGGAGCARPSSSRSIAAITRARCNRSSTRRELIRDGVQHLPRPGGHAVARRPDRQAQEGRLSPRAGDRARRSSRSRSAARSTSCPRGTPRRCRPASGSRSRSARRSMSRARAIDGLMDEVAEFLRATRRERATEFLGERRSACRFCATVTR